MSSHFSTPSCIGVDQIDEAQKKRIGQRFKQSLFPVGHRVTNRGSVLETETHFGRLDGQGLSFVGFAVSGEIWILFGAQANKGLTTKIRLLLAGPL